jgi:alpha-1,6-mannosyltransferase
LVFDLEIRREGRADPRCPRAAAWFGGPVDLQSQPHLIDTTMLFAPKSGGVKRYLLAKQAWLREARPGVQHTLVVPGDATRTALRGTATIAAARLPFGDGYRYPASIRKWADQLVALQPDVIEAGDPFGPGHAALEAGERLGVPVVGFCHTDPAALAALHIGEWAEPTVRRRWAQFFRRFDRVIAPSRHIADRLACAGVPDVRVQPLGVDTTLFRPDCADREGLRRQLGLSPETRLLIFAGRAAREKNIDVLLETILKLGAPYHLVLVGAGQFAKPQAHTTFIDFQRDTAAVARLLASANAFVHANDKEPFGLIALEAMASGLPIVCVKSGGLSEIVDQEIGQLAERATASAMAEAVQALFARDPVAIGAAARHRAETRHGWAATFEGLTTLYAELTGAPKRYGAVIPMSLHPRLNLATNEA